MKKVCVIDSGFSKTDKNINTEQIERAFTVEYGVNGFYISEGADDTIGHGTAVMTILQQGSNRNVLYTVIKIFDDQLECDENRLIYALQYVYENIDCDLINLSLGVTSCSHGKRLLEVCSKLYSRNTVIVSAFDNAGAVSYPAAFSCVIGVDNNDVCKNRNDFAYIEDSIVNIFAFGKMQRISTGLSRYMYVSGSSVACAHVTRVLSENASFNSLNEALDVLLELSNYIFKKADSLKLYHPAFSVQDIENAIVFPLSKETQSLLKFDFLLNFNIKNIYDSPKSGNVGRRIMTYDGNREYSVSSWKSINWTDEFDTVILGHLGEYGAVTKEDWLGYFLPLCKQFNKKVYCFDEATDMNFDGVKIACPHKDFIPDKFGKLYSIGCPVLGVFGTGSKQGKYTLQLILRSYFLSNGYKVGQIGSEPSALLFGMDDVFHFGYNEKFELGGTLFIEAVNDSLNKIQEKEVDIIIGGSQSGTIPYGLLNTKYATCRQFDFLSGLNPDKVVLCVNVFDDLSYIRRTIGFIESAGECSVIAVVLFPMTFAGEYAMLGTPTKKETPYNLSKKKTEISEKCNIPCFELGVQNEMDELYFQIIESFS